MSNKGNALVSLIVLALGVVFLWLCNRGNFLHNVVMLCGVAFILPAVINLLSMFFVSKENRQPAGLRLIQLICGVGGLGLGVCIILMPGTFRALLVYLFSALLIVGGAFQVFLVSRKSRPAVYPSWMLVAPILAIVAGVVMICFEAFHDQANEKWVVIVTGVAFVLYGINGLLVSVIGYRQLRKGGAQPAGKDAPKEAPKEVEAPKEKEAAPQHEAAPASGATTSTADYQAVNSASTSVTGTSDRFDSEASADVKRD